MSCHGPSGGQVVATPARLCVACGALYDRLEYISDGSPAVPSIEVDDVVLCCSCGVTMAMTEAGLQVLAGRVVAKLLHDVPAFRELHRKNLLWIQSEEGQAWRERSQRRGGTA